MSESEPPNRSRLPTVRKLRQTKLVFSRNERDNSLMLDIDFEKQKQLNKKSKMSSNKKVKTDEQLVDGQCYQYEATTVAAADESPKVDPRVEDDSQDMIAIESSDEGITSDKISAEHETKTLTLEMEMNCLSDAGDNLSVVKALKTIEELEEECNEMDLKLNTQTFDDSSDDETEQTVNSSEEAFEVESFLDSKVEDMTYYLVKWKNYSDEYNTWEPLRNLGKCRQLLEDFQHIQTVKDETERQQLMKVYQNYYKLKGIIEDVVERKIQNGVMTTLLLKFNGIALKDFNFTKAAVHKMRTDLRDRHLFRMDQISQIKNIGRRVKQMTERYNQFIEELNINKIFGSFEKFFEFFVNRKQLVFRLNKWQSEVNAIITKEKEGQPIRLENFVDCEDPPHYFKYICKCQTFDPNIIISDEPPIFCQCVNCETQSSDCCVPENQSTFVYTKNGILDSRYHQNIIYECNKNCKCSQNCINRVFQKGRKHNLAIFKTDDNKGWGVRALEPIKKGSFVMEYVGEIITAEEADKRGQIYDAEGRTYLFDLDYTPDEIHKYSLDATQCGNVSHFVNHSCDPNLDTRVVWVNNLDPFMPHIALFAVRNIRVNEELTFDYKISVRGITDADRSKIVDQNDKSIDKSDISIDSGIDGSTSEQKVVRVSCHCGASNCRKYLY